MSSVDPEFKYGTWNINDKNYEITITQPGPGGVLGITYLSNLSKYLLGSGEW